MLDFVLARPLRLLDENGRRAHREELHREARERGDRSVLRGGVLQPFFAEAICDG